MVSNLRASAADAFGGLLLAHTALFESLDEELLEAHPGHLGRVLEALEQAMAGALVDAHRKQITSGECGGPGDLVSGLSGENMAQGRLPRAVGAHDRVDLPEGDLEVEVLQDLLPDHRGGQVLDEQGGGHWSSNSR